MELLRGIVHGRTIELENEPGLPDGQAVTVVVQSTGAAAASAGDLPPDSTQPRAFGAWADDADELDRYLEWNRRQRRISRAEMAT
jgi:hypothetical protein